MNVIATTPADINPIAGRAARRLSVTIPCYNEEAGLAELHRRLTATCQKVVGDDYEVILVNDGSRDGTWNAISALAATDPHLIGVDLSRNFGHQAALTAALTLCSGERIFILDADLQDPPELLTDMMAAMDQGADVVYGKRRKRDGESKRKKVTAKLFYRVLAQMIDFDIPTDAGDFRLMSRRVLEALLSMPEAHRFIRGMVSWIGFTQVPIEYDRQSRYAGETGYTFAKMINFALDAITAFSARPLRIGLYAGMGLVGLSWLGILYSLISWLFFSTQPGWTSLIIAVMFLGGAQIFMLAMIGEYVSRTFVQTKGRPLYFLREIVGNSQKAAPDAATETATSRPAETMAV
jgi:glycosyltransferase involved in cell wall biosynthesis